MKKLLFLTITLLVFALQMTACSKTAETDKSIRIGVAYYDKNDTFMGALLDCFRDDIAGYSAEDSEIILSIKAAGGSQRTQNEQVEELISEGCNILMVNLVDRANPSHIIDIARSRDIPVIFFNREPVKEDLNQWEKLYYIGADARQSGTQQGELAAFYIKNNPEVDRNGDGTIQYVLIEGEPGHQDAIIRTESVVDTLVKEGIELDKISYVIANWNRAQGKNRMMPLISEYGSQIEMVLANNDDMALGAVEAYEAAGFALEDMPVIFGIDGTDVGLKAVQEGTLKATVYNDKEGQAVAMSKLAMAVVKNPENVDFDFTEGRTYYLPYYKVDESSVSRYIREN